MRLPIVSAAVLLAALAAFVVVTERRMTAYLHSSGLADCLARHGQCGASANAFMDRFGGLIGVLPLMAFIPLLAGLFWGAPLIAREVEQGTHRLAWTQSVSRRRWVAVRIGLFLLVAVVVAVVLTGLFTWWVQPFARLMSVRPQVSRINPYFFDLQGVVLIANMVYAFAVGTAAGAVVRRTVPAMAVTVVGYLALAVGLRQARAHILAPVSVTSPFADKGTAPWAGVGDWMLHSGFADRFGHPIPDSTVFTTCPESDGATAFFDCTKVHGYQLHETYQPLSRFWALQGIESGILLGVAVALLAAAVWWTLRRIT
jgi:ABC-2 family transporter protein